MPIVMTAAEAAPRRMERVLSAGGTLFSTPYFGASPVFPVGPGQATQDRGPQAFLVEQNPGSIVSPHFHLEDQFQLIIRGGGTLGRHEVAAISVHYANAHNGYGPIVAGETGLAYFTLRRHGDMGAWYLPDASDRMDRKSRRRQATGGPAAAAPGTSVAVEPLLARNDDGLGAWHVSAPARALVDSVIGADDGDRFLVSVNGGISIGDRMLDAFGVAYLAAGETSIVEVGEEAAVFLVLCFPHEPSGTPH